MAQESTKTLKVVVIGGNGTVGKYIVKALKEAHNPKEGRLEIIIGGRQKTSNVEIDISDTKSVANLFKTVKKIDHLIVSCGDAVFGPLSKITKEDYAKGLNSKLLGQIDIVLQAVKCDSINENGSITLTSGLADKVPFPMGHGLAAVNGALNSFVKAAATEMPRGIRVNVVSMGVVSDSMAIYGPVTKGLKPVEGADVALAYIRSIYGGISGKVLEVYSPGSVTEQ